MNNSVVVGGVIVVIVIVAVGLVMYNRSTPTTELTATPDLGAGTTSDVNNDVNSSIMTEGDTSPMPSDMPMDSTSPSPSDTTSPNASAAVKSFTVTGSNYSFTPNQITVKQGDTVSITFKDTAGTHSFNIAEFNVATKMLSAGQQDTVQFVANKAGQFEYYCAVANHRAMGMKGTLIVQ